VKEIGNTVLKAAKVLGAGQEAVLLWFRGLGAFIFLGSAHDTSTNYSSLFITTHLRLMLNS